MERLSIKITAWMLFFQKEKEYGNKKFNLKKITLMSKGFYSAHPLEYNFKENKYSDYVSDIENIKIAYLNYPYGRLLRNKLVFSSFFNSYFQTPESYCLINKGKIEPANIKTYINSVSALMELLTKKRLILKPLFGTHGKGILLLEYIGSNEYKVNKKTVNANELENLIKSLDDYLVSEFIVQSTFSKQFFPDTTNTLRLTTFCDPAKPSSFIPYGYMRFGRAKTIPVDNRSSGGIISFIDLNTGQLGKALESNNGKTTLIDAHPESGTVITGAMIPRWNEIKDFFINLGGVIKPFIKVAGWDVVLTEDSFYVIEGNNGPDLLFQGAGYPIGKDPEVLNFLKYFKIR